MLTIHQLLPSVWGLALVLLTSCADISQSSDQEKTSDIDQKIVAKQERLDDLQSNRRMMLRGAADGAVDTTEIDQEIQQSEDQLEELDSARRMMLRGADG